MPKKKKKQHYLQAKSPKSFQEPNVQTNSLDQENHEVKSNSGSKCRIDHVQQAIALDYLQHFCFLVDYNKKDNILHIHKHVYLFEGLRIGLFDSFEFEFRVSQNDRVIGKPSVIAELHHILILQYICESTKFIKFLVANCTNGDIKYLEDGTRYFKKDFVRAGKLDCHITSIEERLKLFVRLPGTLLSKQKSLVLTSEWDNSDTLVHDLAKHKLQTHKFQAIAVSPSKYLLFVAVVDVFCEKVTLQKLDLRTSCSSPSLEVRTRMGVHSLTKPGSGESLSLINVVISLNQSCDWLVLCVRCVVTSPVEWHHSEKHFLILQMIDPETFQIVNETLHEVKPLRSPIVPIFSQCGSLVKIMDPLAHGNECILAEKLLPRVLNLQSICRHVILKKGFSVKDTSWRLPKKLIDYLSFKIS